MRSDSQHRHPFIVALTLGAACLIAPSTVAADEMEFPEIDIDYRSGYAPHVVVVRPGEETFEPVANITASPLMLLGSLVTRGFVLPIDVEATIAFDDYAALSVEVIGAVFGLEHVVLGGLIGPRLSLGNHSLRDGWYARPAVGALVLEAHVADDSDHRAPTASVVTALVSNVGYQWAWQSGVTMQLAGILGFGVLFGPSADPMVLPLPGIDFKVGVVF